MYRLTSPCKIKFALEQGVQHTTLSITDHNIFIPKYTPPAPDPAASQPLQ